MLRVLGIVGVIGLLLVVAGLPLMAQTATPDPDSVVVVAGPVDLSQGSIMVNGYIIAPASAFQPSILRQGDQVIIIGNLLPDGITIQATSFEFFEPTPEPTPELTPEITPEVTPEATVEVTPEITPEVTPEMTPEITPEATVEATPDTGACNNPNHPVANRLANAFNVTYEEIIGWHCDGFGFGEIARAYLLADASGVSAEDYFDQKNAGMGWGQIVREAGIHPSDLAPGQVIRRQGAEATETAPELQSAGNGQGNGRGNGQGNGNGNGQGNGNGNGNGQGNGNGNGQGNGQGNGNGNGQGNGRGNGN